MRFTNWALITALLWQGVVPTRAQEKGNRPEVFEKVVMLVYKDGKPQELAVRLRLEGETVVIESPGVAQPVKLFQNAEIKSVAYAYSKHPRVGAGVAASGAAMAGVVGISAASLLLLPVAFFALPAALAVFRTKSKRHWLTIMAEKDYAVLRLDKRNHRLILPAFEAHTGLKVERLGEEK